MGKKNGGNGGNKPQELSGPNPLAQLATAAENGSLKFELRLPELPGGEGLEAARARAAEITKQVPTVIQWVARVVAFLIGFFKEAREVQEAFPAEKVREAQDELRRLLRENKVPALRRAAWFGLFKANCGQNILSQEDAGEMMRELVKKDYLLLSSGIGDFVFLGVAYSFSRDSLFEEPDKREAAVLFEQLLRGIEERVKAGWAARTQYLMTLATVTLLEFLAGKPGPCFLKVPAQPKNPGASGNPWRPGGTMLVVSDGQKIVPAVCPDGGYPVTGRISKTVVETAQLGVHVLLYSLPNGDEHDGDRQYPPRVNLPGDMNQHFVWFWWLLSRGIQAGLAEERLKKDKQAFQDRTTITEEDFFLDGEPGMCLATYQGSWKKRGPDGEPTGEGVPNIFFLVERRVSEDGQKVEIELTGIPDHLKKFLSPCVGTFEAKDDHFSGLPQPLRAILQAIFGQISRRTEAGEIVDLQDPTDEEQTEAEPAPEREPARA